jgi:uncharacterized alkaline shock family protein YloU
MSEMGMENTTQQLHYHRRADQTTEGKLATPAQPQTESVSGRVPVAPQPPPPATEAFPVAPQPPAPARRRESGRGLTTIAEDVVERVIQRVVDLTVDEVDGVHGLRPGVDAFFGFVDGAGTGAAGDEDADGTAGSAKKGSGDPDRAVAVKLVDDRATVNLSIEVDFGYAVHEVVEQVRASVISSAERLLGITVTEVNVVVSDVSFDPAAKPGEDT